jgi:hypothetical protein
LKREVFMESWMQMVLTAPLAEAIQPFELAAKRTQRERTLKASQPAEPRQVSEKLPEQAKLVRLETAPVV